MKLKAAAVIVICILALIAAFTWLDIRLMSSRMAADANVAASHRPRDARPNVAFTALHVEGSDGLQRALQSRLGSTLDELPGIGGLQVTENRAPRPDSALIAVRFVERQVFWTPFYARSQLHVHVAYASDGDLSFDDGGEVPRFNNSGDTPTVKFLASYALADVSWGLVSQPGYDDYVAEQIASKVKASLEEQIKKG